MIKIIYRGFNIYRRENGKWFVTAADGEIISADLDTEQLAYEFVDAHKRRGGK